MNGTPCSFPAGVFPSVAVCCSVLQCVAVRYNVSQCVEVCCKRSGRVTRVYFLFMCCRVLQGVARHCKVLQNVAEYGCVLQCVAVYAV